MVKLLVATRSAGKQREIRRLVAGAPIEVVFPDDLNLWEMPAEATLELHDSFQGNARAKAEYFVKQTRMPTVADDSGLEVLSLGGAPGVRSKRWAQVEDASGNVDAANNALLMRKLAGATEARRRARYRCVLVFYRSPSAIPDVFEGICNGSITEAARGDGGFGYDPYFLSDDLGLTFGEATADEKDRVSHRGNAVRALLASLTARPL